MTWLNEVKDLNVSSFISVQNNKWAGLICSNSLYVSAIFVFLLEL